MFLTGVLRCVLPISSFLITDRVFGLANLKCVLLPHVLGEWGPQLCVCVYCTCVCVCVDAYTVMCSGPKDLEASSNSVMCELSVGTVRVLARRVGQGQRGSDRGHPLGRAEVQLFYTTAP